MGFTPCKAEKPQQCKDLQKTEEKKKMINIKGSSLEKTQKGTY